MREVEYIISGEGTAWITKPPAVTGFEEQGQAIDMWHIPAPRTMDESSEESITNGDRIHFIQITPLYRKRSTSWNLTGSHFCGIPWTATSEK